MNIVTFKKLFPKAVKPESIISFLVTKGAAYGLDTKPAIDMFLAQCSVESGSFTIMKESCMYSAERLLVVFPKYFKSLSEAQKYAKSPKIFDRTYANRMGNGPESTGDGSKHCGRGFIQLTGKDNYAAFAKAIGKTIDETIAYLQTVDGAIESAAWFFKRAKCHEVLNDIVECTIRINGGKNGLKERTDAWELLKKSGS